MISVLITLALYGLALEIYLMTATWVVSNRLKNAGLVDPVWAFSYLPVFALFVLLSGAAGVRVWALGAALLLWSGRLSFHLFSRWWREFPTEDRRYARLRQRWGRYAEPKLLLFFLFQGLVSGLMSLPWLAVLCNPGDSLTGLEWAGLAIVVFAVAGESLADLQLARFRKTSAPGRILNTGLWRYSRHPNYFFEWLTWCGFAVFASASPWGASAWLSAALMLVFLLKFTGIAATEAAMKEKRGEEYEAYLRNTSAFLPLIPKR
jgi:steroid 5-alpha reductase family enzyme